MHKEVYLLANVASSWVVHQSNHSEIIKLDNLQEKNQLAILQAKSDYFYLTTDQLICLKINISIGV